MKNGKNFESITQYFNARQKRYKIDDGVNVQKSKEQIRHFYYRTWHKIIKYVSIPMLKINSSVCVNANGTNGNTSNSNNQAQLQISCLIAFNVLMTKLHRWNKKSALKLVELVNHGWTTIREKGKITRLRMPICKVTGKSIASSNKIILIIIIIIIIYLFFFK
jgi:hypothetical protein